MAKDFNEKNLMKELEEDINTSFNAFIPKVISNLEERSAVWTGFYNSSWKASTSVIHNNDYVGSFSPWSGINISAGRTRPTNHKFERRYVIPTFKIKLRKTTTVYISNPVNYPSQAFAASQRLPEYLSFGIKKTMEESFKDRSVISYRSNAPN